MTPETMAAVDTLTRLLDFDAINVEARAPLCQLMDALEQAEQNESMSFDCFRMIVETLTAHGYPVTLQGTPPMFLNDAVHNALAAKNRKLERAERYHDERNEALGHVDWLAHTLKGMTASHRSLRERAEQAEKCNEAMREPMRHLRESVGMWAQGEGSVVDRVLSRWKQAEARLAVLEAALRVGREALARSMANMQESSRVTNGGWYERGLAEVDAALAPPPTREEA